MLTELEEQVINLNQENLCLLLEAIDANRNDIVVRYIENSNNKYDNKYFEELKKKAIITH